MAKIKSIQIQNLHNNGALYEVGKKGVAEILDKSKEYYDSVHRLYVVTNKKGERIGFIENCPVHIIDDVPENEKPKQLPLIPDEKPKAKLTIDQRKEEFVGSFKTHVEKYGAEAVNDFIAYWSEPNQTNTKMRWELQDTWSLGSRLATWVKRSKKEFKQNNDNEQPETTVSGF